MWLKNPENLTAAQIENMAKLKDCDLDTAKAYRMRLTCKRSTVTRLRSQRWCCKTGFSGACAVDSLPWLILQKCCKSTTMGCSVVFIQTNERSA
nr:MULTISPECIES: transposase [unclassified Paenibacillus]